MHALAATGTYVQTCMQFCIIVTIYIYSYQMKSFTVTILFVKMGFPNVLTSKCTYFLMYIFCTYIQDEPL